jgi:hypothetical protein
VLPGVSGEVQLRGFRAAAELGYSLSYPVHARVEELVWAASAAGAQQAAL